MPNITLLATACPAIQVPTLIDPDDSGVAIPAPFLDLTATSGPGSMTTPWKKNWKRAANIAQGGSAAAYAVRSGLVLSTAASLNLPITAGTAIVNGQVFKSTNFTQAVSGAIARVYLWLSSAGTVTAVNNSTTPPAGSQCFLGSCVTDSGNVLSVDTSGVLYLRGGKLVRYTADVGPPTDTPPANLIFDNYSLDGIYRWDGSAYRALQTPVPIAKESIASTEALYVGTGYQAQLFGGLTVLGHAVITGHLLVRE